MGRNISTLTTGQISSILAIAPRKASQLIDKKQLKGDRLLGTRDRRANLGDLIEFMSNHNFPRTRLLRFIEDYGISEGEAGKYNITEPIGTGSIRFYPEIPLYPERPDILTTGQAAKMLNCSVRTVCNGCDNGALDSFRLPGGNRSRRITTDALARDFIKEGKSIPAELEGKSFLLINYPGGWDESQRVVHTPDPDTSVWYRDDGAQEVSIRCGKDGLYVKLKEGICALILLGITGREGSDRVAHPDHIQQVAVYLTQGLGSLADSQSNKNTQKTKEVLEYAKRQFDAYLVGRL